jgi:hypothetical protein
VQNLLRRFQTAHADEASHVPALLDAWLEASDQATKLCTIAFNTARSKGLLRNASAPRSLAATTDRRGGGQNEHAHVRQVSIVVAFSHKISTTLAWQHQIQKKTVWRSRGYPFARLAD